MINNKVVEAMKIVKANCEKNQNDCRFCELQDQCNQRPCNWILEECEQATKTEDYPCRPMGACPYPTKCEDTGKCQWETKNQHDQSKNEIKENTTICCNCKVELIGPTKSFHCPACGHFNTIENIQRLLK